MELEIENKPLAALIDEYPAIVDFLQNLNLSSLNRADTLLNALYALDPALLDEFGITPSDVPSQLADFLETRAREAGAFRAVRSVTILGGRDKSGAAENVTVEIHAGEVVSIVGPTGSGKSRLLADIECLAQADTPTGRRILLDGREVTWEERFELEGRIVAQLSQNMNFVMDLTVREFLEMHAGSRQTLREGVIERVFEKANDLAGEKFTLATRLTELSGGQSRALMIADAAYMSASPIVLIDEIENAGVDRREAIALLAAREKIVLVSTHDPLLALGADSRIVIKNGGIFKVIATTETEKRSLAELEKIDRLLYNMRGKLRAGEMITAVDE
ncbi:MAG: ABC transporter ATP-binding protein [Oscillospiraceae bacterium]|nr:ABC transporter ATP-binding protein [Oscillospiraceae bacterium]